MQDSAHYTQLIPVFSGRLQDQSVQLCNARDLHTTLQVGKVFAAWITERIDAYGFVDGEDFVVFSKSGKNPKGGRPAIDYHLSLDMAKELAMVENNDMGRKVRRYFIDMEREAKKAGIDLPLYITPAQQRQLQEAIAERFPDGKRRPYAWSRFNNHFKLGSYKQLPADQTDEALAYITSMEGGSQETGIISTEAFKQHLQSTRYIMHFTNDGAMVLRELPDGARMLRDEDLAGIIGDPNCMLDRKLLGGIIRAALNRISPQ